MFVETANHYLYRPDLRALLEACYREIEKNGNFPPSFIKDFSQTPLKHEVKHFKCVKRNILRKFIKYGVIVRTDNKERLYKVINKISNTELTKEIKRYENLLILDIKVIKKIKYFEDNEIVWSFTRLGKSLVTKRKAVVDSVERLYKRGILFKDYSRPKPTAATIICPFTYRLTDNYIEQMKLFYTL